MQHDFAILLDPCLGISDDFEIHSTLYLTRGFLGVENISKTNHEWFIWTIWYSENLNMGQNMPSSAQENSSPRLEQETKVTSKCLNNMLANVVSEAASWPSLGSWSSKKKPPLRPQ